MVLGRTLPALQRMDSKSCDSGIPQKNLNEKLLDQNEIENKSQSLDENLFSEKKNYNIERATNNLPREVF